MAYFCYMVECEDGSYYTGMTTDPQRREKQHNAGRGARYTRMHRPVQLVYVEPQPDRTHAMKREQALKKLTHAQKKALIQSTNPNDGNLWAVLPAAQHSNHLQINPNSSSRGINDV